MMTKTRTHKTRTRKKGTLIFFCGKMGAGKSTKARALAEAQNLILIAEDEWLAALYPNQINSPQDYKTYADRLKEPIKSMVQSCLNAGLDVVMDFPANTPGQRQWLKSVADDISAPHQLYVLDRDDETCLQHIAARALAEPARADTDTPEMFYAMKPYFSLPQDDEGLTVIKS